MNFLKRRKSHNNKKLTGNTEDFRKRALIISFVMALTGFFFLVSVLYFTEKLEIIF